MTNQLARRVPPRSSWRFSCSRRDARGQSDGIAGPWSRERWSAIASSSCVGSIADRLHGRLQEEKAMAFVGLAVTLLGFVVAVASLGLASSNTARLVIVLAGIAVSLIG